MSRARVRGRTTGLFLAMAATFVSMALVIVGAITAFTYASGRALAVEVAEDTMAQSAREVASEVRGQLGQLRAAVEALARHLSTNPGGTTGQDTLRPFFETLRDADHLYGLYVALEETGDFHQVIRLPPGATTLGDAPSSAIPPTARAVWRSIEGSADARHERRRYTDERGTTVGAEQRPSTYDPRSRDWYGDALAHDRSRISPIYRFFSNGLPGITIARRFGPPGQAPAGVAAADLTLASLTTLLRQQREGLHDHILVASAQGHLALHDGSLSDETAATLLAKARDARRTDAGMIAFTDDHGVDYLAGVAPIGTDFGLSAELWMLMDERDVVGAIERSTLRAVWIGLAVAALATVLTIWLASRLSGSLRALASSARRMAALDFAEAHVAGSRITEVVAVGETLEQARDTVRRHLDEIQQMTAQRERLQTELDIARDIQRAMLPPLPDRPIGALTLHAALRPARTVGGDFYGFGQEAGEQALWFTIGDVSDKGVPAAFFMARVLTLIEQAANEGAEPVEVLTRAARLLEKNNDACMFATVLVGRIDPHTGRFCLAGAGHEAPVLVRDDGQRTQMVIDGAVPVGLDVQSDYPVIEGTVGPGESLLLYTDGVTDALDATESAFGQARLTGITAPPGDARDLVDSTLAAVDAHAGEVAQYDDITLLAFHRSAHGERDIDA